MLDDQFMQFALKQASLAAAAGEVPVGAVVVKDGVVIATGYNAPISRHDPTAHAEIVALRAAAQALGNYRLDGCELFVTLEPCAMCAGAMLHSRLKRVVFGSFDPKTGAVGSIVNLFDNPALNHQTAVQGGVLADECAAQLQGFFQVKRDQNKRDAKLNHPLRDDALRTPDAAFADLPDYPWQPNYVSDLPSLKGLRLHYLDEGADTSISNLNQITYLCVHGNASWSYQFSSQIPQWLKAGSRVVAPDLIGFGKSDKPKKDAFHTIAQHRQVIAELIERLGLRNIVWVVEGITNAQAASRPYQVPFPDKGFTSALRSFSDQPINLTTPEVWQTCL